MSSVEHCEVDNHPSKETTFRQAKEESCHQEPCIALYEPDAHAHYTPGNDKARQVIACPEIFEHQVAGNVIANVRNVEYGQCNVEFVGSKIEVGSQAVDSSISNIASINKC